MQQPGERDLARASRSWRSAASASGAARLGEVAGGEREPRDEADALLLAVVEHVLGRAVGEVVDVLHRGDREDLLGGLDLLDRAPR